MTAFISRKQSFLILLGGLLAASGLAVLLQYALGGPKLGKIYDFFLDQRPSPPVAREILLIDTGEMIESGDVFTVLKTATELEASDLLLEAPVLGSSPSKMGNIEDFRRNLNDEYRLLGQNIRNLFEAIRVGSVAPAETAAYVERIVELAERGRDRLSMTLAAQDGDGLAETARAIAVFGSFWEARDLRGEPPDELPYYSRPWPDSDGRLRRIAPLEHIVYHSLKPRWEKSEIEMTEEGPTLVMRNGGEERRITLGRDGALLFERPTGETQFRRLDFERFHAYDEADRGMERLLKDAEALGVYSRIRPERIPLFLFDYAASLWEELLKRPSPEKKAGWIAARTAYLDSLEELLNGPAETALVNGFEEILAAEELKEEGQAKLRNLRDDIIRCFAGLREQYLVLTEVRGMLREMLAASFCIMGPAALDGPAESSALLANALLTGSHIEPAQDRYVLFRALAAVFVVMLCIFALRPSAVLIVGIIGAFACAAGFGWSFVISGRWIDPLIPAASCLAGTLFIFFVRLAITRRGARRFRAAYGPVVSKSVLKELVRSGRPRLSATVIARAAVIAVKDPALPGREDREEPAAAAKNAAEFRVKVLKLFREAGAAIIACEGDTILACFGSPLERIYLERTRTETLYGDDPNAHSSHHPVIKAAGFITELLRQGEYDWRFGMDCGNCAFSWSPETGYTANGRAVVRARILSSLASRYKAQLLITDSVREKLNHPVKKLSSLGQGGNRENFYELPVNDKMTHSISRFSEPSPQ